MGKGTARGGGEGTVVVRVEVTGGAYSVIVEEVVVVSRTTVAGTGVPLGGV